MLSNMLTFSVIYVEKCAITNPTLSLPFEPIEYAQLPGLTSAVPD